MRELFDSLLSKGQQIEVTVGWDGTMSTISCTFLASDKEYVAIRLEDGGTRVFRRDMLLYVDVPKTVGENAVGAEDFVSAAGDARGGSPKNGSFEMSEDFSDAKFGEVYNITPTLTAPKIIGKIDLSRFPSKNRIPEANRADEPVENVRGDSDLWMPANGYIERLGPQFGFIRPLDSDGPNIYLPRNEFIAISGVLPAPEEGDHVVFTYGMNSRGTVAKCVHKQCTVYTQEKLISRLSNCDHKNATLLRRQLAEAYDTNSLCDHPESRISRTTMASNYRQRTSAFGREVIEAIENGENVASQDLLSCEKALARSVEYDEYLTSAEKLLRYSKVHDRPRAYQLYLRITKMARDNGDEETALKYVQEACDFYVNEPGSYKTFSDLKERIQHFSGGVESVIPTDEELAEVEARLENSSEE